MGLDGGAEKARRGAAVSDRQIGREVGQGQRHFQGTSNLLKILKLAPKDDETTRVGFHSFRDTVIQELQGADPDNVWAERRRAYVGHAPYEPRDNSAHKLHYMRAWKPKEIAGLHTGITWGQPTGYAP